MVEDLHEETIGGDVSPQKDQSSPEPPQSPPAERPVDITPPVHPLTNPGDNLPENETKNMEVHHHSHEHGKKNWRSYVWEFLMLFLAVFCGFLAEYKLEHVIEHQKEIQYVQSLVEDLKNDQEVISRHIVAVRQSALLMDTLMNILDKPAEINNHTGDLYYLVRLAPRLNPLSTNSRTFDQLKNSGNFRLIGNLTTSNKIMAYYEKFPLIRLLENINETEFTEYKKVASRIFNPAVFRRMEGTNDAIIRGTDNPPLRTTDPELLQELSVFAVYLHGTKKGIIGNAEQLKSSGAELLNYLRDEYNLHE